MEILILVVWLVCGVIAASVMSGKGRSGGGGFALGVLLGPVGLIVALLMRPSEENEAERQLRIERLKRGMQRPSELQGQSDSLNDDVYIGEDVSPDGEKRYRWECDSCGEVGGWERHDRKVDRQASAHQCSQTVHR